MSSETDEDDYEYFLQPVSNQYNITEKIKEANHKLFTSTTTDPISQRRPSAQRVRFKDKLVEYESEDNDKMTPDIGEQQQQQQRIESVEKYDDEDSVDLDEKEVEEITSEIEELMSTESGVEPYDDNDFESESHPINEGDENSTPDLSAFNMAKKKKLTTLAKVVGFGGGRKTPQSESSEEKIMLQRIRTIKECCQFKESNEYKEKLPNYNGFNSRYGLSKEEIERRESGRSRRKQDRSDKQLQEHQQKELVARINEEAFAKWLYEKLRNPNPSSKANPVNMFDVKPAPASTPRKLVVYRQKKNRSKICT